MIKHLQANILFISLALFFLVGLGDARSVKVAVPAHSVSHLPFYVAQEQNFYRGEGLDVEFILMNAPVAVQALIAGDVDFTTAGATGAPPILRGAPLRYFLISYNRPIHWLYARPDIREVKQLKGKKIANSNLGTASDIALRTMLRSQGLDPARDLMLIYIGVLATRYAALVNGSIDATPLTFPWNFMAEEAGFRELADFTKQDSVDITGTVIVPDALSRSEPAVVEKFVRGTLKGLLYARNNRAGTIKVLASRLKVKEDVAGKIYDLSRPSMTADGTLPRAEEKRVIDESLARVGLKEPPLSDRVFNFALVRKIRAELEAGGWKP